MNQEKIDRLIFQKGELLLRLIQNSETGILSGKKIESFLLEMAMEDERLKIDLMRFVDVFPSLKTPSEIQSH